MNIVKLHNKRTERNTGYQWFLTSTTWFNKVKRIHM